MGSTQLRQSVKGTVPATSLIVNAKDVEGMHMLLALGCVGLVY
jgi:hypothetical protein